jgi:hypothetical protein
MSWKHVHSWADKHPVPSLIVAGVAVAIVLAGIGLLAWRLNGKNRAVKVRGLVAVGTLMATMVQASGMWHFFGDVMHMSLAYKIVMFPFLEILILAFGLKALEKAEEAGNWLIYAVMLWILAISSGGMSASDSSGFREGLFRLLVAVVIAVLWTLDLLDLWLKARKKKAEEEGRPLETIRWRFSPREIGIRLGLASADGSTLSDLDANRHFERYLRVSDKLRILKEHNARDNSIQRVAAREAKAKAKLQRHARLHADPSALMTALGAQAVADAQTRLGITEALSELREAKKEAEEHAAETQRLNELLETERAVSVAEIEKLTESLKAEQSAAASAAEQNRYELGKQLAKVGAELEAVRARAAETDLELERTQRDRRDLIAELDIERRERTHIEQLRTENNEGARRRIAALEEQLEQLRTMPSAAIPAQRPAPAAAPAPDPEPSEPEPSPTVNGDSSGRQSAKQAFYEAADELTEQGANQDHPLLSTHAPTRNDAARELVNTLGYEETAVQTVRRYSKAYLDDRKPAGSTR